MATKKVRCKLTEFCRISFARCVRGSMRMKMATGASRAGNALTSRAHPSDLVLPDVSHELGLQSLGTKFAAHMERAFAVGDILIPRAQIERRLVNMLAGCPHQPPAVGTLLQDSAV